MLDTGFPQADAENDFLRARRHQFLATLTNRLRGRPSRAAFHSVAPSLLGDERSTKECLT